MFVMVTLDSYAVLTVPTLGDLTLDVLRLKVAYSDIGTWVRPMYNTGVFGAGDNLRPHEVRDEVRLVLSHGTKSWNDKGSGKAMEHCSRTHNEEGNGTPKLCNGYSNSKGFVSADSHLGSTSDLDCTSVCQPLEMGVIKIFKQHYRKMLVKKVVGLLANRFEGSKVELKMNVLQAFHYIAVACDPEFDDFKKLYKMNVGFNVYASCDEVATCGIQSVEALCDAKQTDSSGEESDSESTAQTKTVPTFSEAHTAVHCLMRETNSDTLLKTETVFHHLRKTATKANLNQCFFQEFIIALQHICPTDTAVLCETGLLFHLTRLRKKWLSSNQCGEQASTLSCAPNFVPLYAIEKGSCCLAKDKSKFLCCMG
ncbi:hypothetical protein PR048_016428 [Dryococelus australis]|uniref:DDE-1 domain-containing protein n=1 Tax=Dryococelus australis TaxID=614101 RepID=A0ABQ9HK86_9NEOP|nr:hypothetical protein PR048_016428 [Dryococelus australis]